MTRDEFGAVREIANHLETSEFEIFRLAYQAWYQETAPVDEIERHFGPYLFSGATPFWVNQYTRSTLTALAETAPAAGRSARRATHGVARTLRLGWAFLSPGWPRFRLGAGEGAWF